jgi:dolichol-phosphate mannosyltransferase
MLTILLPTYNESENIKQYIPKLIPICKNLKIPFEILVVDDNSPDKTWMIVEELSKIYPEVRSINRIGDRGLSSAILFGILNSKYDITCVMDSDMQHDEKILPIMLDRISEYDLVIGSRKVDGGEYGEMPFYRRIMSQIANWLANLIVTIPAKDSMSGFFMVHNSIIREHLEILNPKGFKILLEIICRIKPLKIIEVGYSFRKRIHGKTKLSSSIAIEYLLSLIEIRTNIILDKVLIKFSIVGLLGILVNWITYILVSKYIQSENGISTFERRYISLSLAVLCGFETSVIFNFFLHQFWTFNIRWKRILNHFLWFQFISIFSFLIQFSIWISISFFLEIMKILDIQLANYIANLIGISVAYIINFTLNSRINWRDN